MKHGNNPETAAAFVHGYEMNGSNLYARHNCIYSYCTMIANKCKGVILLNSCDYSHTTQRHKLHITRAANVRLFEVPKICGIWGGSEPSEKDNRTNYEYLCRQAEEAAKKASKARTDRNRIFWTEEAHRRNNEAADYATIFGVI